MYFPSFLLVFLHHQNNDVKIKNDRAKCLTIAVFENKYFAHLPNTASQNDNKLIVKGILDITKSGENEKIITNI